MDWWIISSSSLENGKSLEFDWQGTQLGIKVEGESTFTYVNLQGAKGDKGEQGNQGIKGDVGAIGPTGATGPTGTTSWLGITDKPTAFAPSAHNHSSFPNELGVNSLTINSDTNNYFRVNELALRGASPTITMRDTDGNSAFLHCNSGFFYILRGETDSPIWSSIGNEWPFAVDLNNNDTHVGGVLRVKSQRPRIFLEDTSSNDASFHISVDAGIFHIFCDRDKDDAGEPPHPLVINPATGKGYLFGREIVTL
jgi:hypothetical protein